MTRSGLPYMIAILMAWDFMTDLYEDMARLNALYEEMMWPHEDALTMRIEGDHIVIRNLSQEQRDMLE